MTVTDLGKIPQKGQEKPKDELLEDKDADQDETVEEKDDEDAGDEETADETDADGSGDGNGDEESENETETDPEAQREEIQERLTKEDKKLKEERTSLKQEWEDIEAAHERIKDGIKNPVPLNGKPAYLATEEEFEAAEDAILDSGDKELLALLKRAKTERREYFKRTAALSVKFQKVQEQRTKRTMEDVRHIKDALKEISPEYEKHFNEIETLLKEEFEANPVKLERFVWGGIRDKFRFIDRLLTDSGIKQRVEREIDKKTRPNLAGPGGAGKAKRGTPAGNSSKRIYTRAEIKAMSPAEYERREQEIDKAMIEGRIK